MHISTFPLFGAKNSKAVFEAFEAGAKSIGCTVSQHKYDADIFVIWSMLWTGRMQGNAQVFQHAVSHSKKVIVIEVGGLKRGQTWKVGIEGANGKGYFANDIDLNENRPKELGINLKPWKINGNHILICGQNTKSYLWLEYPRVDLWLKQVITKIRSVSKRPIILRPHPRDKVWAQSIEIKDVTVCFPKKIEDTYDDYDQHNSFNNAWCVINPCSNPGVQAIIQGIPAFVDKTSLAYPVGNFDLSKIEQPKRPDRENWLKKICHTEWTLQEISQGIPQQRLIKVLTD